ncbi:MAG: terminase family protein [Novosphingobium sp.]
MKLSPEDQAKRDEREAERAAAEETLRVLPRGDLLLGYQQRVVDLLFSGTAVLVIEKSRRIGLTWGVAAFATLKAASSTSAGGQNVWYMGYDKDMTLEFIEVCAMWARAFGLVAGELQEEEVLYVDDNGKEQGVKAFSIRMASGFRITALASVPRALRGKQGIVLIDEAAFHNDVQEVIDSAMALLIWGGQVVIISTHFGVENAFNLLIEEIRAGEAGVEGKRKGKVVTITFMDAIADGLAERTALVKKTRGLPVPTKEEFISDTYGYYGDAASQELDCVPKTGAGSLITLDDIIACEDENAGIAEFYQGGLCYVGRDVARRNDGQVQYCMELVGDVLWQRDTYEEVGQTFAHQETFFDNLFATRRVVQARIDQTGMGENPTERAIAKHGASRVVGELLTGPNRYDLAIGLALRFERRKIRIRNDLVTRADLMALKKVGSETSGGIRIVNASKVHADRFWAYALASRAAELAGSLYEYKGIGTDGKLRGMKRGDPGYINPADLPGYRQSRFGHRRGAW